MNELKFIPTYRVINRRNVSRNKVELLLVNLANDFDVITIKVSETASSMIADRSDYSITTRTKRTWYTLWLGKKEEYHVLGNIDEEGKVLMTVTSASLSDEAIENFKKEWKRGNL
ncbi:transcriptional regulator [Staphylococcus phage phiSA_BS1]|uniref:Uncharacterized protein n=2 Tax=Baoshanvirus TaxID=2732969 RepID=A0A2P1MXS6_9CAUD|nr:transcriptional regulator [Staphylococcus phage phiSA_BS1]YP_009799858.1 transcriptional regulator [Staphylococcus phage phiSA_BS2]AVP40379.1 hypothetical protein [Staphylococcus phage phiSA_BS1]AVR55462.1 hypothetical protein phiSABS2_17 [Staphylococcus phage phiSA_BS2]